MKWEWRKSEVRVKGSQSGRGVMRNLFAGGLYRRRWQIQQSDNFDKSNKVITLSKLTSAILLNEINDRRENTAKPLGVCGNLWDLLAGLPQVSWIRLLRCLEEWVAPEFDFPFHSPELINSFERIDSSFLAPSLRQEEHLGSQFRTIRQQHDDRIRLLLEL